MKHIFKQLKSIFYISPASITFTVIFLVVTLFLSGNPILDLIELKTYDLRFRSRGQLQPSTPVVMALIDEKSLDEEGRWPWSRSKIATLVNLLSQDGAKVIGFDIGFLEPDANSKLAIIHGFSQEIGALNIKNPKLDTFIKGDLRRSGLRVGHNSLLRLVERLFLVVLPISVKDVMTGPDIIRL